MKKFLFIGNSHTYFNDMPQLFAKLYRAGTGEPAESVMLSHSGRSWEWHRKEAYEIRYNLLYGGYDDCFLQQAAHPFPGEETTRQCGKYLIDLCKTAGVRPVLVETWAKKDEPQEQAQMNRVYRGMAEENDCLISPVGEVWQEVRKLRPEIDLYYKDGAHASVYGGYLIACCHFRTVTGRSMLDLPNTGIDFSDFRRAEEEGREGLDVLRAREILLDGEYCREIREVIEAIL